MVLAEKYDSKQETLEHIKNVQGKIMKVITELVSRALHHDSSKLESPEKEYYDQYTQHLRGLEYNSHAYKETLKKMQPGINHHYSVNRHHPQFFADSIDGMNLIDLLEMLCDWKAAGERHTLKPTDILQSIEINSDDEHFKISPQLKQILKNTATYLWYE